MEEPPVALPPKVFALHINLRCIGFFALRLDSGPRAGEDVSLITVPPQEARKLRRLHSSPASSSDQPSALHTLQPASAPDPGEVSEAESALPDEDVGQLDEIDLISALGGPGKVLHLNISAPGQPARPACGCFAKGWKHIVDPGPALKFCRHPACNKAVWYD